jgi:hypothetical protein
MEIVSRTRGSRFPNARLGFITGLIVFAFALPGLRSVTYCAVGYRSSETAERLHAAGFTNVRNLDGSTFQWTNEHRPLVRGDQQFTQGPPFNSFGTDSSAMTCALR